ncbi:MAG: AsmA family protein [Candidatus Omnitrophota bacterium]
MYKAGRILIIVLAVLLVLGITKNLLMKAAIQGGVKTVTGCSLSMQKFGFGILTTKTDIRGLKLYNPAGFVDKVMLSMPEILVDYNLTSLFKGKAHLSDMKINMEEFVVVKNKDGKVNLNVLKESLAKEEAPGEKPKEAKKKAKMPEIQIDNMELKIGKVIYKDYSKGGEPTIKEYDINLNEQYKNINNVQSLVGLIVFKALAKTSIAALANIDLAGFKDAASDALASAKEVAVKAADTAKEAAKKTADTAKEAAQKTGDAMKGATEKIGGLLPFGEKK